MFIPKLEHLIHECFEEIINGQLRLRVKVHFIKVVFCLSQCIPNILHGLSANLINHMCVYIYIYISF
jgi:hypothetical protein